MLNTVFICCGVNLFGYSIIFIKSFANSVNQSSIKNYVYPFFEYDFINFLTYPIISFFYYVLSSRLLLQLSHPCYSAVFFPSFRNQGNQIFNFFLASSAILQSFLICSMQIFIKRNHCLGALNTIANKCKISIRYKIVIIQLYCGHIYSITLPLRLIHLYSHPSYNKQHSFPIWIIYLDSQWCLANHLPNLQTTMILNIMSVLFLNMLLQVSLSMIMDLIIILDQWISSVVIQSKIQAHSELCFRLN